MKTIILKDFVDKYSGESYPEGKIVEFEEKRAKALFSLGFAGPIENPAEEPKKEDKQKKATKTKK